MNPEQTPKIHILPTITGELTLWQILDTLSAFDDGELELSEADIQSLHNQLRSKPDSIRYVIDDLDDQGKRHRVYAREHADKARAIENSIERLKKYVVSAMQNAGFEKMSGDEWQVSLLKSESVEIVGEPNEVVRSSYPDFVKTKYEWSLSSVKDAIKAGVPVAFATLNTKYSPRFTVKKGK
jgi:imidazolonepropionase-like amidohydrolase